MKVLSRLRMGGVARQHRGLYCELGNPEDWIIRLQRNPALKDSELTDEAATALAFEAFNASSKVLRALAEHYGVDLTCVRRLVKRFKETGSVHKERSARPTLRLLRLLGARMPKITRITALPALIATQCGIQVAK